MGEAYQDLVAEIMRMFASKANVTVGEWVDGPDGRRELDVSIRGTLNNQQVLIFIECKDYTYSNKPTPVGIKDLDALESKRHDLKANLAMIASNSGFTAPALSKAARTRIVPIAIVKEGDDRAKFKVMHNIILRRMTFGGGELFHTTADGTTIQSLEYGVMSIEGESVDEWLVHQAVMLQFAHPWLTKEVNLDFTFRTPVTATYEGQIYQLSKVAIKFRFSTEWRRQTIELGAGAAMLNFITGKLHFPAGENQLIYRDIDFDRATPSDPPSESEYQVSTNDKKDSVRMLLCWFDKMPKHEVAQNSKISALVLPEDMEAIWSDFPQE